MILEIFVLVIILFILYSIFRLYRRFHHSRATFIRNWCIDTYGKEMGLETFKRALDHAKQLRKK